MAVCGAEVWAALQQGCSSPSFRWDGPGAGDPDRTADVAVVDLALQLGSGTDPADITDLLTGIRSVPVLADAAILAVLGPAATWVVDDVLAAGADDVVTSPVDPALLDLRIRRLRAARAAQGSVDALTGALEHANKQLGQFAHTASHDLKEPLRAVSGFSRLLQTRHADSLDESAQTYLNFILDGAQRMGSMITGLLEFARVSQQDLDLGPVDLHTMVSAIADRRRGEDTGADITVGDLPTLSADEDLVEVLLNALIDNALKFADPDRPNQVAIGADRSGEIWHVRVSDAGVGIPVSGRDRVFDLFSRLHSREEYPGEGLGLGMAAVIAQRLGGELEADSTEGAGTTMTLSLPAAD